MIRRLRGSRVNNARVQPAQAGVDTESGAKIAQHRRRPLIVRAFQRGAEELQQRHDKERERDAHRQVAQCLEA